MKKLAILIFSLLIIGGAALGLGYRELISYGERPGGTDTRQTVFIVTPGQGLQTIGKKLFDAGLIQSPLRFRLLARMKGYDRRIQAGEYRLAAVMRPNEIFDILTTGRVHLYRITIPEGYQLRQIADIVARADLCAAADFIRAATDPELLSQYQVKADSFEGYLFPETYFFPGDTDCRTMVRTMVDRFWSVFSPAWKERAAQMGFSVHQIVTLASIIEKETGVDYERPLVSSVMHNRLKKNMRLETDPTVIYGIKDFDGNLTRKHLETYTPYNTYIISGLPPGPIANPGKASLEAALYPANTAYLFFVSKKDTTHHFSSSYTEHLRAVKKYQLRR